MSYNNLDQVYSDILNLQIEQGIRTVEDLPFIAREHPFVYKGMGIEEYWGERVYYSQHVTEIKNGTYCPL